MDVGNALAKRHKQRVVFQLSLEQGRQQINRDRRCFTAIQNDLHPMLMMGSQFIESFAGAVKRVVVSGQNQRFIRDQGFKLLV